MTNVSLCGRRQSILDSARELKAGILARRDEIEQARRLPDSLVQELKQRGIFRLAMPTDWGGPECDPLQQLEIIEALSEADGSVGWCAAIGLSGGYLSSRLDQDAAREIHSDLDAATGYVIRPAGRAVAVPGGYSVSGRWTYGSGCQYSSWMASGCMVYDGDIVRRNAGGQPETLVCYLPAGSYSVIETWHTTGLLGTGSHDFAASDVFVPGEYTFNMQSSPIRRDEPLYQMPRMYLILHAAVALGLARAAIDNFVEVAVEKQTMFGTRLCDESYAQSTVARAEAIVGSARSYVFNIMGDIWNGLLDGRQISPRQRAQFRLAIVHAHTAAKEAVDMIYSAAGGSSLRRTGLIDRIFRDVHSAAQHIIASPGNYDSAGQMLLGLDPADPTF